ncbi:hypothetical protein [Nocardia sp. N2S4-5]|uniref:DUF6414 family protein n=1 Tax=Nocardia sp. N2S4-5 TaxID=3351565 RepID=UPI0037D76FFB
MRSAYQPPEQSLHRGFFYLNDELVTNSLSSLEAGRIDDIVSKAVTAREGGGALGGGVTVGPVTAKGDYSKKGSTTMEESLTKTRTRFSIFQIWYDLLKEKNALGAFSGWGPEALRSVEPGHTLVLHAVIDVIPIYALMRMFLWYSEELEKGNPLFIEGAAQAAEEAARATGEAVQTISTEETMHSASYVRSLLGGNERSTFTVLADPVGEPGPAVGMELNDRWLVGSTSSLGGSYTIVGQVHRVLTPDEWMQTLRLVNEGPTTELERTAMQEAISHFIEPAAGFGMTVRPDDGEIHGPALWLEPIAIFR